MEIFKDFKVGYFFTMESGRNVTKNLMVNEGLPVIQGGETNRGILGFVSEDFALANKLNIIEDPLFLTVARVGSSGYVALHDKKSVIGDNAKVLRCKLTYSLNVMLYLQTCLNKFGVFYDYSNVVSEKNYLNHLISLPVTPDGFPDYAYMEDYIKGIQRQYIDNLLETNEAERNRLLSIVGLSLDEYERVKGNVDLVDAESYGEFKVGDLFESINKTNKVFPFSKTSVPDKEHNISATSATISEGNYGYFVKEEEHNLLTDCLSMNSNGGFGLSYYHNDKFAISQDSYALFSKERIKPNVYIYFSTLINKVSVNYSYTDKPGWSKIKNELIQVPTTETGEIDYAYMEDYISKIKLIYIYNRELSVNEQVRLLESLIADKELVTNN